VLWEARRGGHRDFDIYVPAAPDLDGVQLVIPRSRTSPEYAPQIARVLQTLAAVEDRDEPEIAKAIRQVGFDVVRSRIPDVQVLDDAIHLSIARNFVSGIRSVLASAATTELHPAPYFLRLLKEASEYADRCRFGHTFRGSFGFTLESPLEPTKQEQLPGILAEIPFERRVIQRLARGLHSVARAVATDSTDPITSSMKTGFNANICENLAGLVEQTSPSGLTFEFAFSPEIPADGKEYAQEPCYTLGLPHVEVIKAAAKQLRDEIQSWSETVFGRVIRLASDVDPSDLTDMLGDREVAIHWSSDVHGDILVRASLTPGDYLMALEAHASGRPVEISGTLERRPRRWVLTNPSGLFVR
jgi:hypothetical protein